MGLGTKASVYRTGQLGRDDALLGYQELNIGFGYASGQPAICHFGLGAERAVDLQVVLPNGRVIKQFGVSANQRLNLKEQ
jgi:hypothetical protein